MTRVIRKKLQRLAGQEMLIWSSAIDMHFKKRIYSRLKEIQVNEEYIISLNEVAKGRLEREDIKIAKRSKPFDCSSGLVKSKRQWIKVVMGIKRGQKYAIWISRWVLFDIKYGKLVTILDKGKGPLNNRELASKTYA